MDMKILSIGLPKTGITSLAKSLQLSNIYLYGNPWDYKLYSKLVKNKYNIFDYIDKKFTGLNDLPSCIFWKEIYN